MIKIRFVGFFVKKFQPFCKSGVPREHDSVHPVDSTAPVFSAHRSLEMSVTLCDNRLLKFGGKFQKRSGLDRTLTLRSGEHSSPPSHSMEGGREERKVPLWVWQTWCHNLHSQVSRSSHAPFPLHEETCPSLCSSSWVLWAVRTGAGS